MSSSNLARLLAAALAVGAACSLGSDPVSGPDAFDSLGRDDAGREGGPDSPTDRIDVTDGSEPGDTAQVWRGFLPKPAGYWSFDQPTMTTSNRGPDGGLALAVSDDLDGVHPAVIYGGGIKPGYVGKALWCDGQGHTDIAHDSRFEPVNSGSVSMWVLTTRPPKDTGRDQQFFAKGTYQRDWDIIAFPADNRFHFNAGTWPTIGREVVAQEWFHLVGTYEADVSVRIYVNGKLEYDNAEVTVRSPDSLPIRLCNGNWFTDRPVAGLIDELAVWEEALTKNQVAELYARGVAGLSLSAPLTATSNGDGG